MTYLFTPEDLLIETFRGDKDISTGRTGYRITHIPTNTTVKCYKYKISWKNRDQALNKLNDILKSLKNEEFNTSFRDKCIYDLMEDNDKLKKEIQELRDTLK